MGSLCGLSTGESRRRPERDLVWGLARVSVPPAQHLRALRVEGEEGRRLRLGLPRRGSPAIARRGTQCED